MALVTQLPPDYAGGVSQLNRFLQESSAALGKLTGPVKAPQPPRSIVAQPSTQSCLVTWQPPADSTGIVGYRIYSPTESAPSRAAAGTTQGLSATIPMAGSAKQYASVCSYNASGMESQKVPIVLRSNSNQVVTSGAGINGSYPAPPPGWPY